LAGQQVGIKQVDDRIWLGSFMHYDLGYFDDETCRLEPIDNLLRCYHPCTRKRPPGPS
jgi:putative transposase